MICIENVGFRDLVLLLDILHMGRARESDYLSDKEVNEIFQRLSRNAGGAVREDLVRLYKRIKAMKMQLEQRDAELDSYRQPPLTFTELSVLKEQQQKRFDQPKEPNVRVSKEERLYLMVKEGKIDSDEWKRALYWGRLRQEEALAIAKAYEEKMMESSGGKIAS